MHEFYKRNSFKREKFNNKSVTFENIKEFLNTKID